MLIDGPPPHQVHRVVLHDGRVCAMKVQYPGIAESIDSDIDNLMMYAPARLAPISPRPDDSHLPTR